MIIRNAFFSTLYAMAQIGLGLVVHPYQTMQSLVQERLFIWMTLLPTISLAVVTVLWRFGIVPLVRVVFSCKTTSFLGCDALPLLSDWITFFCVYWQILLLYLLARFTSVYKKN